MIPPKEKAEELFDKFYRILPSYADEGQIEWQSAKQCALIAVDEIIKYSPNKPDYEFDPIEYFNKVKQEIENI